MDFGEALDSECPVHVQSSLSGHGFFWGGGGWHPSYYYPLLRVLGSVSNTEFSERGLFGDCFGEVVPKVARSARMPSKTSAPPKV